MENGALVNAHNMLKSIQKVPLPINTENALVLPSLSRELRSKVSVMYSIVKYLKNDVEGYRLYLRKAMSEWKVEALSAFKIMNESVDKYLHNLYEEGRRAKERMVDDEDWKNKCQSLQLEVDKLNKSLEKEKESAIAAKREGVQREDRLKKIQHYSNNDG